MRDTRIATLLTGLAVIALGAAVPAAAQQPSAEVLLEQAMHVERVEGNLQRAIELYQRVLREHPTDRVVGAKAQLHIGLCYETLGRTEAQRAYRRVIDQYADRPDEVAVARQRLAGLSRALAGQVRRPTFTRIEIASKPQNGVLSPDGRRLAFVSEGGVWVVPLHGNVDSTVAGEPVRIADVPGAWNFGNVLAWSADGEWIAVNGSESENAVYLVPAGGGEARRIPMPARAGPWSYRLSLSPDGGRLAFTALEPGTAGQEANMFARQVYVVATAGGEPRRLSSGWGSQAAFSPDGEFIAYVGFRERHDLPENAPLPSLPWSGDLWVAPSAGGAPVKLATADGLLIGPVWSPDRRFIAVQGPPGGRGVLEVWVYPVSADASSAGEPIKIALLRRSVGTLAGWTPDGRLGIFMVSESHLALYTVPAAGGKAVQVTPEGVVYYPRFSPDGTRIYLRWVRPNQDPPVRMAYVAATGGDVVEVPWPERPLMSVVPGGGHNISPDGKQIVVSAAELPVDPGHGGDVWTIPMDGGRPTRLTNDRSAERYPCWSPDGQWIAFKEWYERSADEGYTAIFLVPAGGGPVRQVTSEADSVGDGAIAFAPDGRRIAYFSRGAIMTVPTEGRRPEVLVADVRSGRHSQLQWSADGTRIAHNAGGGIWITRLGGGRPEQLRTGLPDGAELGDFGWSPDGEKIVFMASTGGDLEFWLISDFLPRER
jgi:Tol biopolymer transport system component